MSDTRETDADPIYRPNVLDTPDSRRSRSMEYGLAMLECFSGGTPHLRVSELADMIGISGSTTHRYASTLVSLGFLEQDQSRRYRLAPHAADVSLGLLAMISTHTDSLPVLEELRDQTDHTASLAVMDGPRAIYVQRVHGHGRDQYRADLDLRTGAHLPLHCTAVGKAMLASQSTALRHALIEDMQLTRTGPSTITSEDTLLEELAKIGTEGLAVSDEEQAVGVRSIAQAIHDPTEGHTLAVEVTAPAADHTPKQLERLVGPKLRTAAQFISGQLRR